MSDLRAAGGVAPVLYITYDGALDPLGRSQVVPYLEGLSRFGYRHHLLSFEKPERWRDSGARAKMRARLTASHITWHPLRYHKRPPLVSTLLDVWAGTRAALRLARASRAGLVHARSYPSSLIALRLRRRLGVPFVFDMRGFYPEERVDGGLWRPGGSMFRLAKRLERDFLREASGVVTLTEASLPILRRTLGDAGGEGHLRVIPTAVDLDRFRPTPTAPEGFTLAYFGSVGTWYLMDEMFALGRTALECIPDCTLRFVVNGAEAEVRGRAAAAGIAPRRLQVRTVDHERVPEALADAHATFFLIKPLGSKVASAATKFGESLALGLPVACNRGVGDSADVIEREGVGVVVERFEEPEYRRVATELCALAKRADTAGRCRDVARARYSLGGAVDAYRGLYEAIGVR